MAGLHVFSCAVQRMAQNSLEFTPRQKRHPTSGIPAMMKRHENSSQ
jgi:hypothetical protein